MERGGEEPRGDKIIKEEPRGAKRRGEERSREVRRGAERRGEEPNRAEPSREERSRAAEVIKAKGDNTFLGVGGIPHVGVRAYFKENATRSGLTRKDGRVFL